jgi:DNA-binding response OmpR family regulator
MKILIAEDDTISRFFLEKTLQKLGHMVTACKDGAEAWKAFQQGDYPMVISDWMMPETDGLELCRRIRRHSRSKECYFMMLTARTSKSDFIEAMAVGADDYITKPLDGDEIEVRLRMAERMLAVKRAQAGPLHRS